MISGYRYGNISMAGKMARQPHREKSPMRQIGGRA
jgi:hypothetical protein